MGAGLGSLSYSIFTPFSAMNYRPFCILLLAVLCMVGLSSCISSNFSEITAEKSLSRKGIMVGGDGKMKIGTYKGESYLVGNVVGYHLKYERYFSEVHQGMKILRTEDIIHHVYPQRLYLKIDSQLAERIEKYSHLSLTEQTALFVSLSDAMQEGEWVCLKGVNQVKEIPFNQQWRIINVEKEGNWLSGLSSAVVFIAVDIPTTACANALFPLIALYGLISGEGW